MRLEAPANGIPCTCASLRGSGSLLEISKPSDLEKQLTERRGWGGYVGGEFFNQTASEMPHAIEEKSKKKKSRAS